MAPTTKPALLHRETLKAKATLMEELVGVYQHGGQVRTKHHKIYPFKVKKSQNILAQIHRIRQVLSEIQEPQPLETQELLVDQGIFLAVEEALKQDHF